MPMGRRLAGAGRPTRPARRLGRAGNAGFLQGLEAGRSEAQLAQATVAARELSLRRAAEARYASVQAAGGLQRTGMATAVDPQAVDPSQIPGAQAPGAQSLEMADIIESIGLAAEGIGKGWGAYRGASAAPAEAGGAVLPKVRQNLGWLAVLGAAAVAAGYWFLKKKGK